MMSDLRAVPSGGIVLSGGPVLEYQPAVDLATGRLLGFEALVRWEHPTKGRIAPDVLIPWIETTGDIGALDTWVVAEACTQAQGWPSGIQLAVNCSMVLLQTGRCSTAVEEALRTSGLNPDRLIVEVPGRTIADHEAACDLQALASLGVHLAVDDVTTSWQALEALRRFAIDTVQIDKAFIAGLGADGANRSIVEALVSVSHSLAMSTVAEGVETAEQVAILRRLGADAAQGYFFARPLPPDVAAALAATEPRPKYSFTVANADNAHLTATMEHAGDSSSAHATPVKDVNGGPEQLSPTGDVPEGALASSMSSAGEAAPS